MNFSKIKKTYPYLLSILFFISLSYFYFSPVIEGKIIMGHDTQSYFGMAKECVDYTEKTGEHQYWTNSMFGGMPTYQIQAHQENNFLTYLHKAFNVFPRPVSFSFLYLICAFLLLLTFGLSPWLSMLGSVLFTFASYNFIIIAAGHNTKAISIAYIMPLIGSVILAFQGKRLVGAILTAVFLGLAILANHYQILYYALYILIIYFFIELYYAIKEKKLIELSKTTAVLILAALLGIGANASALFTTYEYSKYTMRGESNDLTIDKDSSQDGLNASYITAWSYGIDETMTLLIPNFKGGASGGVLGKNSHTAQKLQTLGVADIESFMQEFKLPLYWGTQPFTSGPVYVGAVACFLFVLGLFIVKGRYKWWLLAVTLVSIVLSWGENFPLVTNFFIEYVPMYNKFRTVSMTLVMAGISIPLLALLAVKTILTEEYSKEKILQALTYSFTIVGGILFVFIAFPSLAGNFIGATDAHQFTGQYEFLKETLILDRRAMLRSDAFRSLVFVFLTALLFYLFIKEKLKLTYGLIALGVLFVLDLVPIAKRYLNDSHFVENDMMYRPHRATEADKIILKDKDLNYRVLNLSVDPFNNAAPSYFHKNIGGYHAAKLRRYQELINIHLSKEIQGFIEELGKIQSEEDLQTSLQTLSLLHMLNMKYLILNPNATPILNSYANGNAWLVEKAQIAENANEEMLLLGEINTKTTLVVDKMYENLLVLSEKDSLASIQLITYQPMHLKYQFSSTKNQLAVFSEIFYDKGWNAYINGEKVPYFRANYLLRAMSLEAGNYEIEFRFEPKSVKIGDMIAIIASLLIFILSAYALYVGLLRKNAVNKKIINNDKV